MHAHTLEDPSQSFHSPSEPDKKLTKTQSYDMGISQLALPNGTPEPGKLRPSTSEETLHKSAETDLQKGSENITNNLDAKVDRRSKRGRSPFKFFSKKEKKEKSGPTKTVDSKTSSKIPENQAIGSPMDAAANSRIAMINIITPSSSDQKIIPPFVPARPTMLTMPMMDKGLLSTPRMQHRKSLSGAETLEMEGDILEYCSLENIDEYYFGVRIFPGQDPNHVYVGWVTTNYHYYDKSFDISKVRKVTFNRVDADEVEV